MEEAEAHIFLQPLEEVEAAVELHKSLRLLKEVEAIADVPVY